MACNLETDVTRRFLLAASVGLLLPRWTWGESLNGEVLCWKLEESGDAAKELVSGTSDAISSRTGHAIWVGADSDRALRLDGYSVWINHDAKQIPLRGGTLSISAWLALESYPVEQAAIVQIGSPSEAMICFSVDRLGFLLCKAQKGKASTISKSESPLPKAEWVHVAVVLGSAGITLYANASPCGYTPFELPVETGRVQFNSDARITLGRSTDCSMIADVFPTGVLNGLLRDVRVFDRQIEQGAIAAIMKASQSSEDLRQPDKMDKNDRPDLQINGPWCANDVQRPRYHALPPRAWTNEPHGLIQWRGQYHLFYQKNPNGPYWGHIHWGHMTSPDLLRWTELPVALSPEPGPDAEGCWSGSVIEYEGKLATLYTAGDGKRSSICLALTDDGLTFTKHSGNPVIAEPPVGHGYAEFRDPFVWREGDTFYLIIGSSVKDVGGTALLYRSKDLIHWEYRKPLLVGDRETSGVFWEMPIFVKLGEQHALIVCEVPGRASYWVGSWKDESFVPLTESPQRLELFNHLLSPTPMRDADGNITVMGIIPDQRSPRECWRAGWAHLYSLPRALSADVRGRIHQTASMETDRWMQPLYSVVGVVLGDGQMKTIEQAAGTALNLRIVFERKNSQAVILRVRSSEDGQEQTDLRYEWEIGKLVLDRSRSSLNPEVHKDVQEATYFPDSEGLLELDLYLDNSVLEVFLDKRAAFACRIYPTLHSSMSVAMGCVGGTAEVKSFTARTVRTAV